ncbi:MAG: aminotransferase class I/II-fold pyridoxal phosphate-dependent enzyme [Mangrovibacterium sp.]
MNYQQEIQRLQAHGLLRSLRQVEPQGNGKCRYEGREMINLSSNDYLGLSSDYALLRQFKAQLGQHPRWFALGASSSRLLSGNYPLYEEVEEQLCRMYDAQAALFFNSGYHANLGILPALAQKGDLILSDKLCHASLIDGIRLSAAEHIRYRHLDYQHLASILERKRQHYRQVFVVSESVFSMDGDEVNLQKLVALKEQFNTLLYIDEAHSIGVKGVQGLGSCETQQAIGKIDLLVGTLGKAYASVGAFAVLGKELQQMLVNRARTLIYTTALPPINLAWTKFVLDQMPLFQEKRLRLASLSSLLSQALHAKGYPTNESHIQPLIIGDNQAAVALAEHLQREGFLIFPIRPPTVPPGTARLRLSLTADLSPAVLQSFAELIPRKEVQR